MPTYTTEKIGRAARRISKTSLPIALDGWKSTNYLHVADRRTSVRRAWVTFVAPANIGGGETSGVLMMLGTLEDPLKFSTITSATTQTLGDNIELPISPTSAFLEVNEVLTINTAIGKTGAGIIIVQIELDES